jgi:predicted PurR-regulated permease PerM
MHVHEVSASHTARSALVVLALGLVVYLLWRLQEVLFLLFLAILLSTTIEPIVNRLRRGVFSRGTGVLAIYTVIILTLGLPAVLLAPSLVAQAASFTEELPTRITALRPYAERLQPLPLRQVTVSGLDQVVTELQSPVAPKGETIVAASATVIHFVLDFLLVFVLAFYWMMERNSLKRSLLRLVPRHHTKDVNLVWLELEEKLGAWVRGQLFLMLVIGVLGGIGFVIFGLPSPIVLAIAAAVGEMIPIVGPYLAFAPAILITLATDPSKLLLLVGYALVVQIVENNILVPRVMNRVVGISPLAIILGIQAGAILYGIPGALLAVPVAAAIQVILAHTVGTSSSVGSMQVEPERLEESEPTGSTSAGVSRV